MNYKYPLNQNSKFKLDSKDGKNQNLYSLENENDGNKEINDIIFDSNYNRNWFKFNNYSCRHDSFFLLYAFILFDILKDIKDNPIINVYNNITEELLKMNKNELNNGIWIILSKQKILELDLTANGYK